MGNDPGRGGSRSDEPPPLAAVRHLHLDDVDATDEWYETERLSGHLTGGAQSATTSDRPAPSQQGAPVVLDWRHATPATPPTARERLGRTLAERRSRRRSRGPQDTAVLSPAWTRAIKRAALDAASQAEQPPALDREDDDHAPDAPARSGPRISLREPADWIAQRPKRRYVLSASDGHSRLRRAVIVIAVVLSVAVVSVVGIVAETGSTAVKPPRTSPTAAASGPTGAGLSTVATTVSSALQTFARARKGRPAHRTVRARRRARHPARSRPRHSSRRPAVSRHQSSPAVTTPTATPSASGSANVSPVSTSSYSRSSSLPAYSAQPAASEPAPATTKRVPLPAGPIGPGGTVGNNCNPKCS